jgi:TolB-like protein/Tfp pilus assembly protein PilF/predicted Ser/Thr protein kinase
MLSPGDRLGPYSIVACIGKGGMGNVYRATDTRMGRDVAIKVVPERFMQRFDREVRAIAALNHPNICTIHDVGPNYLVMEYLAGERLRGPLPETMALQWAARIAVALEVAHKRGIVHRDLKPANIIVTGDQLKLLDFGIASFRAAGSTAPAPQLVSIPSHTHSEAVTIADSSAESGETVAGTVLGTPAYMSPEQASGLTADARSDIFSFGIVLFELLSGRQPFKSDTVETTLLAVRNGEPPSLQTSPEVAQVVARCLRKDPAERFQTMGELRSALARAAASLEKKSVAVLPFTMLGAGAESDYFSEGLTEDIVTALSGVSGLRVIARSATLAFRAGAHDVRAIAAVLGVSYVLEGSVRVSASQVRVNSRLIAADSGAQIWSGRYDRNLIDVFAIQDEIAAAIAAELKISLTRQEPAKAPTIHFAAYEAVLEGRYHFYRFAPGDQAASLACFEKALAIDPNYAAAHVGIAQYYWGQMFAGMEDPHVCLELSFKSISEALRLDPDNSDVNFVLANHYALSDFDWEKAEHHFDRAIELNPNSQWAYTCKGILLLSPLGRLEEALACHEKALVIDPLSLPILSNRAFVLECLKNYEGEENALERIHQLDPNYVPGQWNRIRQRARRGHADEARELAERWAQASGRWGMTLGALGIAYAAAGRKEDAQAILDELALEPHRNSQALYSFFITSGLGDLDAAFHWAFASLERRDPLMLGHLWGDSFARLREDARFADLLAMLRINGSPSLRGGLAIE